MALLPHLPDRVLQILTRYSMLKRGDLIGVAVSGGADSVALLHILCLAAAANGVALTVVHCNHGLRARESDADQEFVEQLAESLSLPCYARPGVPAAGNLEQEARRARHRVFAEAREALGLTTIALGHTRTDQAETVLLRFLRGSGTAGLAGMPWKSADGFIRPLLGAGREEVRSWLQSENRSWRNDGTNEDRSLQRNRLRLDIMPLLAGFNSNLEGTLAGTAEVARAEDEYWAEITSELYRAVAWRGRFGICLPVREINWLHAASARRLIREALCRLRTDLRSLDLKHVEQIRAICQSAHGHDRTMAPRVDALRSFDTLILATPGALSCERQFRIEVELNQEYSLPYSGGQFSLTEAKCTPSFCANFKGDSHFPIERAELDADVLQNGERPAPLAIRNWEPGDTIELAGKSGPEKIKTLFQERRVYLWERKHWPVLALGNEIVWARSFGCANRFRASERTARVLQLQYEDDSGERRFEARV